MLIFSFSLYSQNCNLITNGGFEQFNPSSGDDFDLGNVLGWQDLFPNADIVNNLGTNKALIKDASGNVSESIMTNINLSPNVLYLFSGDYQTYIVGNPTPLSINISAETSGNPNDIFNNSQQVGLHNITSPNSTTFSTVFVPDVFTNILFLHLPITGSSQVALIDNLTLIPVSYNNVNVCSNIDTIAPISCASDISSIQGIGFEWSSVPDGAILDGENTLYPVINTSFASTLTLKVSIGALSETLSIEVTPDPDALVVDSEVLFDINQNAGSIDLTVTAGQAPYNFDWSFDGVSGFSSNEDLMGLEPGIYTVIITDNNDCTHYEEFIISSCHTAYYLYLNHARCPSNSSTASNGSVIITSISSSIPPYQVFIDGAEINSPPLPNNIINFGQPVDPGNHTILVIDGNNCALQKNFNISEPADFDANINTQDVTCNGGSDGSFSTGLGQFSGGTQPYTGPYVGPSSNLSAGQYNITIKDQNSCFYTAQAVINEPQAISPNVSCYGANGRIYYQSNPTNGAGGYTYDWNYGNFWNSWGANSFNIHFAASTQNVNESVSYIDLIVKDANQCSVHWSKNSHIYSCFQQRRDLEIDESINDDFNDLSVYPNPVGDVLKINYDKDAYDIRSVKVYNSLSKLVINTNDCKEGIPVSDLQSGFYIIEIETTLGKEVLKFSKK